MIRRIVLSAGFLAALVAVAPDAASATDPYAVTQVWNRNFANQYPWHGAYYYLPYGQPTALVVPPTANQRQTFSWGVSQNLMYPIHHQFGRSANWPGAARPGQFRPTPAWPSHTDQFGLYYVRGPW